MKFISVIFCILSFLQTFDFVTFAYENVDIPPALIQTIEQKKTSETHYDFRLWAQHLKKREWFQAVHLWSTLEEKIPAAVAQESKAIYLLLLWNEGLPQTFVNQLIATSSNHKFLKSSAWTEVHKKLSKVFGKFLFDQAIFLSAQQQHQVDALPSQGMLQDLKSWAAVRRDTAVATQKTSGTMPWQPWIDISYAKSLLKANKSDEASAFLQDRLKMPGLNDEQKSQYYITLARIAFQEADLEKAEAWYTRIPSNASMTLEAHEELLWVLLRRGDVTKLRGHLQTMRRENIQDRFMPEVFIVRAISDLKLCFFDEAKDDFSFFISQNQAWAKKIDAALEQSKVEMPPNADWYSQLIERSLELRKNELAQVQSKFKTSIAATLPAVGKQKHWTDNQNYLTSLIGQLERSRVEEYKRQWRNNAVMLSEAIRKMKFVRIELLSQLNDGEKSNTQSETAQKETDESKEKIQQEANGRWSFPFDGLEWADEKFALRSTAGSVCL